MRVPPGTPAKDTVIVKTLVVMNNIIASTYHLKQYSHRPLKAYLRILHDSALFTVNYIHSNLVYTHKKGHR